MACYSRKQAKDLWDYAKAKYLSVPTARGYPDFKELTNALSDDIYKATGGKRIVPEDIARLIAQPKTLRGPTKNLLMADKNRQKMLSQARSFVTQTERTPLGKFLSGAYQAPYSAKVVGHGPALHMTHAWPYALDPARWGIFAKTWVNSWKAMNPSNARAFAEGIMLDPRFDEKVKSGLAVDPRATYDDVQNRAQFMGALGHMTRNSFIGLKQLRSWTWDQMYDAAPDYLKTQEMRDSISLRVNHMTGAPGPAAKLAMSGTAGDVARGVAFAPSLDIARVMRAYDLGKDVTLSARELANKTPFMADKLKQFWGERSLEEQFVARQNMKQWARIAAVFSGVLYGNQQLLTHFFKSKEKINTNNPFAPDWLAGKGPNGREWQFTGGEVPMIRAATRMVEKPAQAGDVLGSYLMGKINPALSLAKGIYTGKTFDKKPIPTISSGLPQWAEYLTTELGPIATEDGIKEFSKQMSDQNGLDQDWNAKLLRATRNAGLVTIPSVLGTHTYQPESKTTTTKVGKMTH